MTEVDIQTHVYIQWSYTLGDAIDFSDPLCDITQYRQKVDIRGGGQAGERTARTGTCKIMVNNSTTRFSPRRQFGPYAGNLLPMKPVKVTATDGANTWTVFTGFTQSFKPQPDKRGERKAVISCVDIIGVIQASNIDIPLRENVRSDQLILDVLNYALKAPIATSVYSFSLNAVDNDTITVNGTVYTAKTTPSAPNHVRIGTVAAQGRYGTIRAFVNAINGWESVGDSQYYAGTTQPANVRARVNDSWYEIIRRSEPVRHYRFGEASGTVAFDNGGNLANGTHVNPSLNATGLITNDSDKAITLDGTVRYVSLPTMEFENRSFTVEFWFRPAASPSISGDIFSIHTAFSANKAFFMRYNDGSNGLMSAYFYGGVQVDSGVLVSGTDYLFTAIYDYASRTLTLKVNGATVDTATSAGPYTGTSPVIEFGSYTAAGANYPKGVADELMIWLRPLSDDEISAHYAAKSAPSPGFTVYSMLRGAIGNTFTSAESSSVITVSGATLSGGADTPNVTTSIQTGLRTFAYAGDDWEGEKMSAMAAIKAIVESERGKFYVKRDGTIVFENYAEEFKAISATPVLDTYGGAGGEPVITLEGDMTSDDIANAVTVRFTPRSDTSSGVVAQITSPIKVPGRWGEQSSDVNRDKAWYANGRPVGDPGQTVVNLPYTDPTTGQRIGAKNLTAPLVPTTDWTANEAADGSMVDYTTYSPQQLYFSLAPKASGVDVFIRNNALGPLYVRTLQVRGTLIKRYDAQTITREDVDSIAVYGRKLRQISLTLEADSNFATAIAEYELSRNSEPLWRPKRVGWRNILQDKNGNKVLAAELGSTMLLHEYQTMDDLNQIQVRACGISYTFGMKNEFSSTFDIEVVDDRIFGIYGGTLANYDTANYTI